MSAAWSIQALEPALTGLAGVPQDPVYHGEGDVLTHTRLVMEALEKQPSFLTLDGDGREILRLAAALHDLGKKTCTRLEDGRWRSHGHSAAGAKIARELLMGRLGMGGTPETLRMREAVCALVRWHMRPLHIFEAETPGRELRRMAALGQLTQEFSLEKLAVLAEADSRGRLCADLDRQLETVELFRELAEEQGCLRGPFPYGDAWSRYADLSGKSVLPDQPVYRKSWGTVVMMSGLPGTGKDTYLSRNYAGLPALSLDNIRLEMNAAPGAMEGAVAQKARERARELLRKKQSFVFNATNLSEPVRARWISLFHQYGAAVQIVYLETGWEERKRRNLSRRDSVPEAAVERMLRSFSPPTFTEAEDVRWICV